MKKILLLTFAFLSPFSVYAEQCAQSALHTACLTDENILVTKSEYAQWYLGHDVADNEFHEALNVPAGGLQVIVDNQSTVVRHQDGYVYALGGKFSIRKNQPLILPIYFTDDVAFKGFDLYMVKDGKLHWYDTSARTLTSPVQGLPDVKSVEGGEDLIITDMDDNTYSYDADTGTLDQLTDGADTTVPEIQDVQPGGSYIITGSGFGQDQGLVSMNGHTFEVKTWSDTEIHIENPPYDLEGYLLVTSSAGVESNEWFVLLDSAAPSETPIEPVEQCPEYTIFDHMGKVEDAGFIIIEELPTCPLPEVLTLDAHIEAVKAAGKIVLDSMPSPEVVEVEIIKEVLVERDYTVSELQQMLKAAKKGKRKAKRSDCKPGKGHGDKNHCHTHSQDHKKHKKNKRGK